MVRRIVHRFSVIAAQSGDIHRLFHCRPVCEPTPYVGWDKRQRRPTIHSIWWACAPLVPPCLQIHKLASRANYFERPAFGDLLTYSLTL